MEETSLNRLMDPGRGEFCATTKQGNPLPLPPNRREPIANKDNPRGVRHPGKTVQDHQPVGERPRVKAWQKRLDRMSR